MSSKAFPVKDVPVAILAGGLGQRLKPLSQKIPKALVDVVGKPFVARQLELLRKQGLKRIVLCVGHLGGMIQEVIGDGMRYGLQIDYAFDGPRLLGTGGALRRARDLLGDEFFVLYGDSYLEFDYMAAYSTFKKSQRLGLMSVYKESNRRQPSNVLYARGEILAYDKRQPTPDMHHIDYGLSILKAAALDEIPEEQPYDLGDLYHFLAARGELAGYEVFRRFYEIGSQDGLEKIRAYFLKRKTEGAARGCGFHVLF